MLEFFLDQLKIHGPLAAVLGVMALIGERHITGDRKARAALSRRVHELEIDRVTRADVKAVYDRIEAVSTQIQTNQNTLLGVLAQASRRE